MSHRFSPITAVVQLFAATLLLGAESDCGALTDGSGDDGGEALELGWECESDDECAEGLECLERGDPDTGACTGAEKICSKTCSGDESCTDLDPEAACFGTGTCENAPDICDIL